MGRAGKGMADMSCTIPPNILPQQLTHVQPLYASMKDPRSHA